MWVLTEHLQGMIMSILMAKRGHVQCPSVLSEDLRGGSLWGLQEAAQKSKPQIHHESSNGKPSLHLSRLPIVTLLSGTKALIPPGSVPPLLPVCTSPICPPPLAPTSQCCPSQSSHTFLSGLNHAPQILLLPVFFFHRTSGWNHF